MRNKCEANHVLYRDGVYYYVRRVPYDLIIDYLRGGHLSLEICKSNAFVDRDVSKQKHSILKIKAIMVSPIKLGAIA